MKATKKKSNSTLYIAIGIVVVIVAAVLISRLQSNGAANTTASGYDPSLPKVKSEGYVLGSPTAPVHVVEIADFECPGCGQYATLTEPDVRTHFIDSGVVQVRYIDFPLPVHRNTWNASRAAACADEQGKFWAYHDQLFATQDQWNGEATNNPDPVLKDIAKQLGLNTDQFNQCVDSKKYQAKIQAHYEIGEKHANVTPTFYFNGKKVEGAIPYDEFKKQVMEAKSRPVTPDEGGVLPVDSTERPLGDTTVAGKLKVAAPGTAGGKTGDSATVKRAATGAPPGTTPGKKP